MKSSILAALASAAVVCNAQVSSIYVTPVAPTTSVVTYKTIRCSTYYASTKVNPVRRTTIGYTTNYPETIYPYIYVNSTSTASTCYSSLGSAVSVTANVNAAVTRFPSAVYCTKSVSIVRATYVTSPTSTLTRLVYAYPTTDPQGVQWAIYPNNEGADTDTTYSTFEPRVFTNSTPYYHASSNTIGGFSGTASADSAYVPFYNSAVAFNQSYFVLNHRWYLHAPSTGTYTVSIPAVNDIAFLYAGNNAYSNYSRASSNSTATASAPVTYTLQATEGEYVPMRLIYAQATDAYSLGFTLTAPDGTVLLGPSSAASAAVVQYGCNGYAGDAPPFPAFGSEQYSYTYLD